MEEIVDVFTDETINEDVLKKYMLKFIEQGDNEYLQKVIKESNIKITKKDKPKRQNIKQKLTTNTDISKVKAINSVKDIINNDIRTSGSNSSSATPNDVIAISNYVINALLQKKLKETEKKENLQKNEMIYKVLIILLPILSNLLQYIITLFVNKNYESN